ncbi:MAG: CDP-alcohol phosphatidyltransferase family protein [Chloroflexota bacterium]|nr:CDP-alcohol phosphatidyltransferase family protein [Dehalococcoidia bacterium]MDW8253299.1 CDP-alcohol phosphatidyltransferase family protein [Chloroflexota bacterium]
MKALRPLAARLTAPLLGALARTPITPNQLTVVGAAVNAAVAVVIAVGENRVAGILVLLASAFDLLDGALARASGRVSRFGAFLDSTLDRFGDAALFFGTAWRGVRTGNPLLTLLAFLACVASLLVSYTRARAEGVGAKGEVGLFDRPARIVVLAAGLMTNRLPPALLLITLGAAATVIQRIVAVRQQLSA